MRRQTALSADQTYCVVYNRADEAQVQLKEMLRAVLSLKIETLNILQTNVNEQRDLSKKQKGSVEAI